MSDDFDYLARRANQERDAAASATHVEARLAHQALADRFADRAASAAGFEDEQTRPRLALVSSHGDAKA